MFDFFTNTIWGWLSLGGGVIAVALAVAWFFPPFRKLALTVAAGAVAVLAIYSKGASDARRREREKRDAAVEKARAKYDQIDGRPDTPSDASKRLRDGSF